MKIQPINNFNKVIIKNNVKKNEKKSIYHDSENLLSFDYKVARAFIGQNGITFKNSDRPSEKIFEFDEKNNILNLSNLRIYNFPKTNLEAFVKLNENNPNSYLTILIEPDKDHYDILNHALVDSAIKSRFDKNGLDDLYDFEFGSNIEFLSTHTKGNLSDFDLKMVNTLLTDSNFSEKELELAKNSVREYILSPEFDVENSFAEVIYADSVSTKDETIKRLDSVTVQDLKNYYKDYLNNAKIQMFLTIDKNEMDNAVLFNLDSGIQEKFAKDIQRTAFSLNSEPKLIYKDSDKVALRLNHFVNSESRKDYIIQKFISKIITKYSLKEQKKLNDFVESFISKAHASEEDAEKLNFYREVYKKHFESDFLIFSEIENIKGMPEPLTKKSNSKVFGEYYQNVLLENMENTDNIDFKSLIAEQYEFYNSLLEKDLKRDVAELKEGYKAQLRQALNEEDSVAISNLTLASLGNDTLNLSKTLDAIDENDVKNYLKKYFIDQPPVVELEAPSGLQTGKNISFTGRVQAVNTLKKVSRKASTASLKALKNAINSFFERNKDIALLPVVVKPIVANMSNRNEKIAKKILDEVDKTKKTFTDNMEKAYKSLEDLGITPDPKYIDPVTGRLNQAGKIEIKKAKAKLEKAAKKGEVNFKGGEHEKTVEAKDTKEIDSMDNVGDNLQEVGSIDDLDSIDEVGSVDIDETLQQLDDLDLNVDLDDLDIDFEPLDGSVIDILLDASEMLE